MPTQNQFRDKTILVTGGTGSIGSEIVRQLLKQQPKAVRVFARHEDRHHKMMQEFGLSPENNQKNLRFIIGDVRDKDRLQMAMEGADIVFHAAALKHVPMAEYNPFEVIKTNVLGVQNVIDLARNLGVEKVINISTDKAVNPIGILGVSKLMGEKLILASYYYKGHKKTQFSCVRFGNVLGSRGSILPLMKKQILGKGVVTVTDPEMTRFVMTIPQAVNLVLNAANLSQGQEIFVLKMPAVKMGDLAKAAIKHYAPLAGKDPSEVKIQFIGKREGEKDHESLLAEHELKMAMETENMYILTPQQKVVGLEYNKNYPNASKFKARSKHYLSNYAPKLLQNELINLIKESDSPRYY